MINKLIVFHRHFEGILDCFKTVSKTVNADQPKADVFSQGELHNLSYDVVSGSEITPCNKIDKPLVVYRLTGNVMTSIIALLT